MKLDPIITSLLETDQYKVNMQQVVLHQFNKDVVKWCFKCRNADVKFTPEMISEIKEQIAHFCTLRFTDEERSWLKKTLPWLTQDYIEFLKHWRPDPSEIFVNDMFNHVYNSCGLTIEARGPWLNTMMYEIPILAIVNEVYFAFKYGVGAKESEFIEKTVEKIAKLTSGELDIGIFSEFGLRRRYSKKMQDYLIKYLADKKAEGKLPGFVGTSNLFLAKKYNVKPVGTMAHEMFLGLEGHHEYNPAYVNMLVMKAWVKEFQTDNGTILTDAITTDCFLRDFNKTYATLFSGARHDSGDPIEWGEKMIAHYKSLGIDPTTKLLLFSDSLNFEKAAKIKAHFDGKCKVAFGIGTFLSNPLNDPLNIVMKTTECNGAPVAKLSDVEGKGMCNSEEFIAYLRRAIEWRLKFDNAKA